MATLQSEAYWERRAAARMDMIQADAETTLRKLNRAYRGATASMSVQINSMVRTFGKRYGLSPEEAAKILAEPASKETLEILRETVKSMPDGIEKNRAMATLNAPSARFRISNTQAMRTQAQAVCSKIANEEYKLFTDSLTKSINSAYMRTQYDLQVGLGLSWKTTGISKRVLKQLLNEDWSGANYRTRIMGRYSDLGNELSTLMLEGMLGGRSQEQLVEEMQHQFAMDARDARRLLVTETTYVVNAAELERYKEWGTKEYIYMAVLDLKTSDICATLDGMVIDVKHAKADKNFPPMHPNCRSTTAPIVNRRILKDLSRKATDPFTGEIMTLQPGTTYADWYKQVVEKHGERKTQFDKTYMAKTGAEKLKGAEKAQGISKKLLSYALNTEHEDGKNKAIVFESALGYNKDNADLLEKEIRRGLDTYKAVKKAETEYGEKYEVMMMVTGANGKRAPVATVWMVDEKSTRMVTTYVYTKM